MTSVEATSVRVRFAPSPTGKLHVGNARTALFNWLWAKRHGGTLVLRIEDTDRDRSTKESELAILEDLRWLGLIWTEGLEVGGDKGPYRQSERLDLYRDYAKQLVDQELAYYCFCSEAVLETNRRAALQAGRPLMYPGTCRQLQSQDVQARLDAGAPAAIRFRVPAHQEVSFCDAVRGTVRFDTAVIGDPVLMRSEGVPAYNFAVVIDDALMEITHVIRGEDHISNTPRQLLLYKAFGWTPPIFAHASLVMGADHSPLSKRHGTVSVADFRAQGYMPEALTNYLALIGWSPGEDKELLPLDDLAQRFQLDATRRSAGVFDIEKLAWVNRHYLKEAEPSLITRSAVIYLRSKDWLSSELTSSDFSFLECFIPSVASSVDRLEQIPDRLTFLFDYSVERAMQDQDIRRAIEEPATRQVIDVLVDELCKRGRLLDRDAFREVSTSIRKRTGNKGRALFHPIRIALTGETSGMELDVAVPAMEQGAELPVESGICRISGACERAESFLAMMKSLS